MKILNEKIWDYHSADAVSSTKLDAFHTSPLRYFETYVTKVLRPENTWSLDMGSAFHFAMESDAAFESAVVPMQFPDFRTNKAKEWRDEMAAAQKLIVTADELTALRKMKARVEAHPIASQLIANTEAEVTWRRSFGKFTVQCRADRWSDKPREIILPTKPGAPLQLHTHFVDFKTCTSIAQFKKNWINFGYPRQCVFYREVITACQSAEQPTGDIPKPDGFWIVSESEPPHECRVFHLGAASLPVAYGEVMMDLRLLRRCYETGEWSLPAEIEELDFPVWSVKQAEERLLKQRERLELT